MAVIVCVDCGCTVRRQSWTRNRVCFLVSSRKEKEAFILDIWSTLHHCYHSLLDPWQEPQCIKCIVLTDNGGSLCLLCLSLTNLLLDEVKDTVGLHIRTPTRPRMVSNIKQAGNLCCRLLPPWLSW